MEQGTTVAVEVETEPTTEPVQLTGESSERTLGRLEAETEQLSEEVEEAAETAEAAEAAAETAQQSAYATANELSEIRTEFQQFRAEMTEFIQSLENEDDHESTADVEEVEIPITQPEPIENPKSSSLLAKILFGA